MTYPGYVHLLYSIVISDVREILVGIPVSNCFGGNSRFYKVLFWNPDGNEFFWRTQYLPAVCNIDRALKKLGDLQWINNKEQMLSMATWFLCLGKTDSESHKSCVRTDLHYG